MNYLSLFIPAYNEEKNLEKNILRTYSVLNKYKIKNPHFFFEIVIVDDCSKDKTSEIADNLSKSIKEIRVLHYFGIKPTRRENLIKSFKLAKGNIIGFTDSDSSLDEKEIINAYNKIIAGNDVVIGNRYDSESKTKRSVKRFLLSRMLNFITSLFFPKSYLGYPFYRRDYFCGLKIFTKESITEILKQTGVDNLERSMWWDAEMLIIAQKLGYKIMPIPVKWHEENSTKLRFLREYKIIPYIIKFWQSHG